MKRKLVLTFLLILLCALCTAFGACGLFNGNSNGGGNSGSEAKLVKVGSATPDGNEVYVFADKDTWNIYFDTVEVSKGSSWMAFYNEECTDRMEGIHFKSKSGSLANGNNVFYIKVTSGDWQTSNTYKLTIYKSYLVAVKYYDGDKYLTDNIAYTGEEYTATFVPELVGYTFDGWLDAENNAFSSGIVWDNIDLYASKTPNTYKATLDANGGEELEETDAFITYDSDFTLPVTERYGHNFAGWYADDTQVTDGTGKALDVWNFAEDTALTARWTLKQYMLEILNTDNVAGSVSAGGLCDHGSTARVNAFPKDDYTFMGWYDEDDELLTMDTHYEFEIFEDRTLTAKWDLFTFTIQSEQGGIVSRVYAVNFDLNGGSGDVPETQYVSKVAGLAYPVNFTPTREGYMFRGWFTEPKPTVDERPYDFTATIEGDMTLYAGWYGPLSDDIIIELNVMHKTVNLKGATSSGNSKSLYFCPVYNGNYTFAYESWQIVPDSEKNNRGMSFVVYNITDSGSDTVVFDGSFKDLSEEYTRQVYLQAGKIYRFDAWRIHDDNNDYFFSVGVTGNGVRPSEGGRTSSMAAQTPIRSGTVFTIEASTDTGYEFLGWYDESGELVSMELVLEVTMPYASKVYTAKWRLKS